MPAADSFRALAAAYRAVAAHHKDLTLAPDLPQRESDRHRVEARHARELAAHFLWRAKLQDTLYVHPAATGA